jgi:uncharacterized SAM-binding protein YcdF (DUF218 family)
VWIVFFSLPATSHTLRRALEASFPPITVKQLPKEKAIVVLGGSIRPPLDEDGLPDLRDSADRIWHAARLFNASRAPLVVLSGGCDLNVRAYPEAEAMRVFLSDLGVSQSAVLLESRCRNTREIAQFAADLLFPIGVMDILLVTSSLHMGRAVALFELNGFSVTASATDYETRNCFNWKDFIPDADALSGSARAIKEIVGRALGR